MNILSKSAVLVGLLSFLGVGCQNKVHDENIALHKENRELRDRLSAAPDPSQLQTMQEEIAMRNAKIQELEDQLRQPAPGGGAQPGLEGIDATYDPQAGTVTVNLPGDVLFDSGKASLKESAKSTLNKIIAAIRKDYPAKQIFVDGHTDTDPINKSRGKWEDNLDLSAARARAVVNHLTSNGLDSKQVVLRAYGSNNPKANKAASRRVEVVVVVR